MILYTLSATFRGYLLRGTPLPSPIKTNQPVAAGGALGERTSLRRDCVPMAAAMGLKALGMPGAFPLYGDGRSESMDSTGSRAFILSGMILPDESPATGPIHTGAEAVERWAPGTHEDVVWWLYDRIGDGADAHCRGLVRMRQRPNRPT